MWHTLKTWKAIIVMLVAPITANPGPKEPPVAVMTPGGRGEDTGQPQGVKCSPWGSGCPMAVAAAISVKQCPM